MDRLGKYGEFTVEKARAYHKATYSIGMGAGRRFSRQVDLSGRSRLMDLGGGSGAYSIVATEKFEGLKAVVLAELYRHYSLFIGELHNFQ